MPPLSAAAPDSSQHDVDLTVGFDDLFMMLIVVAGVCLAVLVAFAVAALVATRLERSADEVAQGHPEERVTGLRSPAAPGLPRKHLTVPLGRSVVRRLASPAPAAPSARGYRTAPLPRHVLEAVKTYTKHCFADQRAAAHR